MGDVRLFTCFVFWGILAPLAIITGLALSPALVAKYPGFLKLFDTRHKTDIKTHPTGGYFIRRHIFIMGIRCKFFRRNTI